MPTHAYCRAKEKDSSKESSWNFGGLVLFEKRDGKVALGRVEESDGKKNALVLEAHVSIYTHCLCVPAIYQEVKRS